ncbi:MAG TPA: hypothetical protein DEE98_01685 [Elusimicrobia bacterium]|nr:MAG: hypothetical protein A2278_06030 [Elusimicrobia bacterium RIFOXYA12_FULL_49_49]OGS10866.1 MAG: hypothetical protein A2386_06080 [Elusimicrobia bacterium RIFOXYB1_FULL_48_9]OGS16650.1 MAG: hypothetical protein A2251_04705 [Elusimicrobia bacterium RIFOXYA2_FULL_47_53]OGS25499.1 MAG: hypothetical protein A2339_00280 [Elusimicrobia bacterium RIFOXYB12_FULL_50_12]OGS31628.1 MAG: hypothetical protein A2323_03425 [Elusimicrobia bacterium RIFOXYB2_FULL_46_23]HBU69075.1 hypothetical protein [El
MKGIFAFIFAVIILFFSAVWFAKSGHLQAFLDSHPNTVVNPQLEYYWAVGLELSGREDSAVRRYARVLEKYPDSEYAPLAWFASIDYFDSMGNRPMVTEEGQKFLDKYPDHPKSELIRKKLEYIKGTL